jgi:hypothetical protein
MEVFGEIPALAMAFVGDVVPLMPGLEVLIISKWKR